MEDPSLFRFLRDHLRESLAFMRISPQGDSKGESKRRGDGSKETAMGFVILNLSRKIHKNQSQRREEEITIAGRCRGGSGRLGLNRRGENSQNKGNNSQNGNKSLE